MNKKISIGLCLSLIIVSITATFAVTMVVSKQIYNGIISNISQRSQTYESVDEISKIISNYFYGTVEDRSYLNSALVEGYVNGLGDPNSVYLDAEEYAEYTDTLEGGITGVGVETAYDYGNSPAQRAELDWLLYNKPLEYAQMVLRGEMERYLSLGCDHGRLED